MTSVSSLAAGPPALVNVGPKTKAGPQPQQEQKPADTLKADDGGPAFSSPLTTVDPSSGIAIQVFRDSATGQQTNQYPSKQVVEQYARGSKVGSNVAPANNSNDQNG
ncbi:MAG: hypothetical protein Q7R40_17695 [Phaeospirillum sp.]|nr:hypothetical protein [Phaeospirillum sp.]